MENRVNRKRLYLKFYEIIEKLDYSTLESRAYITQVEEKTEI